MIGYWGQRRIGVEIMPHVGAKAQRLPLILAQLNAAIAPSDMGLPGLPVTLYGLNIFSLLPRRRI